MRSKIHLDLSRIHVMYGMYMFRMCHTRRVYQNKLISRPVVYMSRKRTHTITLHTQNTEQYNVTEKHKVITEILLHGCSFICYLILW